MPVAGSVGADGRRRSQADIPDPGLRPDEAALAGGARPARRFLRGISRGDILFATGVAIAYVVATCLAATAYHLTPDRMMVLAERILQGRLDDPTFAHTVDSVALNGRYYVAVGPLQVVPYLAFVPLGPFHGLARYVVSLIPGLVAAWLALPLARAYGLRDGTAYWVAAFTAFGTLLFYVAVFGDMYYLAHAESFLALELFLLEWAGRRRPAVLGVLLAASFLARPTTILAGIPFGLALLWQRREGWARAAFAFVAPLGLAIVAFGLYNAARFGSPMESGYALSLLFNAALIDRRSHGVFSISQVPENVRLAILALPRLRPSLPFVVPDGYGMSMLLVSPGLLVAVRAGFRPPAQRLMWAASALIAVPVLLYYGGGYVQYGFRYSLDFTPFLVVLVALAARRHLGWLERSLFIASAASVTFGVLWHALSAL